MPVFNAAFLRPGAVKSGGSGYGILIDQLTIKENELSIDGKLSAGDYDVLIEQARKLANSGQLTADQRSSVTVKISAYERSKATAALGDTNDIGRLNREVEDDRRKINMMLGTNPAGFLEAQADLLQGKIERLTESINQLDTSGGDATAYYSEQSAALQELQDTLDAQDQVSKYTGNAPSGDFIAYIDTNSRGEITKVKVGRVGDESGYAETNAVYGGMQVYGKPNAKRGGENVFRFGTTEYKGSDLQISDTTIPGSFRSAPLLSSTFTGNRNVGMITEGWEKVEPATLRTQTSIRPGGFARGQYGIMYESLPTGSYRKYVNTLPDQLGINDRDILDIPRGMEAGLNSSSSETVDGSAMPQMSMERPQAEAAVSAAGQQEPEATRQPATPLGRSRTPAPTERAPSGASGLARRTMNAAKGFLGIG